MLPEELARIKIDKQLQDSGWDIVSRMEYIPNTTSACPLIICLNEAIRQLSPFRPNSKEYRWRFTMVWTVLPKKISTTLQNTLNF